MAVDTFRAIDGALRPSEWESTHEQSLRIAPAACSHGAPLPGVVNRPEAREISNLLAAKSGDSVSEPWGGSTRESLPAEVSGRVFTASLHGAAGPHAADPRAAGLAQAALATALVDDPLEDNDSAYTARDLGTMTGSRAYEHLVQADRNDWYRFTLPTAVANGSVAIAFTHALGDLDLELYNSRGQRLRISNGIANSEQASLQGLAAGTYYVRVYGYRGTTNPDYRLSFNLGQTAVDVPHATNPTPSPSGPPTTIATPPSASDGFDIQFAFNGMTASQRAIFEQAAQKWESIIVGDLPNATYNGQTVDDLLIDARASAIDGRGGVLGQAGPDRLRNGSRLPYHGVMEFDSADLASMEANGTLYGVILHEMGHVLGVGTLWSMKGLLSGAGTSNPQFTGAQATAAYNQIFNVSATGVPVESGGGSGTRDAHFSESLFRSELMTGYVGPGTVMPLSRITVGSLADIGYTVNYAGADPYSRSGSSSSLATSPAAISSAGSRARIASGWSAPASLVGAMLDPGAPVPAVQPGASLASVQRQPPTSAADGTHHQPRQDEFASPRFQMLAGQERAGRFSRASAWAEAVDELFGCDEELELELV